MPREVIRTPDAPSSPYFSQAIKAGGTIYVAGTIGALPGSAAPVSPQIEDQARQAMINCRAILQAAGANLEDVVDVHTLLFHPEDAPAFNEVFMTFYPTDPPARSVGKLGVARDGILVSIKMIAVVDE